MMKIMNNKKIENLLKYKIYYKYKGIIKNEIL